MSLKFSYPSDFEKLWRAYPNNASKYQAFKAFEKLKLEQSDVDELVMHVTTRAKKDVKWLGDKNGKKFIPHLSTFLNGRRWEDYYESINVSNVMARTTGPVVEDEDESKRKWARAEYAAGRNVPDSYMKYLEALDEFDQGSW